MSPVNVQPQPKNEHFSSSESCECELIYYIDLQNGPESVKMKQRTKHPGQSYCLDADTHLANCSTRTTKVTGKRFAYRHVGGLA